MTQTTKNRNWNRLSDLIQVFYLRALLFGRLLLFFGDDTSNKKWNLFSVTICTILENRTDCNCIGYGLWMFVHGMNTLARKPDLTHATQTIYRWGTGLQSETMNGNFWLCFTHKSFCSSKHSQCFGWLIIKMTSQELGDEKRKQVLELNKQILLIVSANVSRDLWMNVVLLYCGGSTKSHSLQYTAQAGISVSPFPLGGFQSRSPQGWKIKTESLLHILWPDWCCSYHKGSLVRNIDPYYLLYLHSRLYPFLIPVCI